MVEVVDLRTRVMLRLNEPDAAVDRFLVDEGLDLLSDFRSITDPTVRVAIRDMVKKIAVAAQPIASSDDLV